MINERRYILIDFTQVTQPMIDNCIQTSIDTLRHVKFENDLTDWAVLKWRGDKPAELWSEFPVYSREEMIDILLDDLNSQNMLPNLINDGTSN